MNNFTDEQGYIHAQPNVFNAENAIKITIEHAILNHLNVLLQVYDYLSNCSVDKVDTKYKLSHDNLTACYAYLQWIIINLSLIYPTSILIYPNSEGARYKAIILIRSCIDLVIEKRKELNSSHPREWAFYNLFEDKGFKPLNEFFLSIVMIWSCLFKYQTSVHGHKERDSKKLSKVKRYVMKVIPFVKFDNYYRVHQVDTSGKLLCWLRFKSGINMPVTKSICNWLLKKHFGSWLNVFKGYYVSEHLILKSETKEFEA